MSDFRRIENADFAVEFRRRGDRLAHAFFARDSNGSWRELLASVEGDVDQPWPASPALQELHVETRGGLEIALLVGRAGTSHWSASISFTSAGLLADIACRVSERPERLGSSYTAEVPIQAISEHEAQLQTSGNSWNLTANAPVAVVQSNGLRIVPPAALTFPATVRWQYEVSRSGA